MSSALLSSKEGQVLRATYVFVHVDEIIHNGEQLECRKVPGISYLRL